MFAIRRFHYVLRFFFLDFILTGVRNISEFMQQDGRGKKKENLV